MAVEVSLGDVIQIAVFLVSAAIVFQSSRSATAANTVALKETRTDIERLRDQMSRQHTQLDVKMASRLDQIAGDLQRYGENQAGDRATLYALIPRVERCETHIDQMGQRVGIGRAVPPAG